MDEIQEKRTHPVHCGFVLFGKRDYPRSTVYLDVNKNKSWTVSWFVSLLLFCLFERNRRFVTELTWPRIKKEPWTLLCLLGRRCHSAKRTRLQIVPPFQCTIRARGKLQAGPTCCLRRPHCKELRRRLWEYVSLSIGRTRFHFFGVRLLLKNNKWFWSFKNKVYNVWFELFFRDILVHK